MPKDKKYIKNNNTTIQYITFERSSNEQEPKNDYKIISSSKNADYIFDLDTFTVIKRTYFRR